MINYSGDGITIEEMPQGCIIAQKNEITQEVGDIKYVCVASRVDVIALIESLGRLLESMERK